MHWGAHVVVYSLTKFINGTNDCVGGAVCGDYEFVSSLRNVNDGAAMLLGPANGQLESSFNFEEHAYIAHSYETTQCKRNVYLAKPRENGR